MLVKNQKVGDETGFARRTTPDEILLTQSLKEGNKRMPWLEQTVANSPPDSAPEKGCIYVDELGIKGCSSKDVLLLEKKPSESDTDEDFCEFLSTTFSSGSSCWRVLFCSKLGRLMLFCVTLLIIYLSYACWIGNGVEGGYKKPAAAASLNFSFANTVLLDLCAAFEKQRISGELCNRLCYNKTWNILDFYQGNKIVITLRRGGQDVVLKSLHPSIKDFEEISSRVKENVYTDAVLDVINENLCLGWPKHYKRHLIETLWPTYLRNSHNILTEADRRSLWSLIAQDEYVVFRLLPLSRVTPQVIGTCGHFYQVEHLVPFRMKGYYTKLKTKILVHLMGTLKLFDEFLNEPLQWCDVKFDNLGLAADYPKRFMVMDADMLYTESRLDKILTTRSCEKDEDCKFFDCVSKCSNSTGHCTSRTNNNLEVFCTKLVYQLFGGYGSSSNRYLAACYDVKVPLEERLNSLRLAWAWNLADV